MAETGRTKFKYAIDERCFRLVDLSLDADDFGESLFHPGRVQDRDVVVSQTVSPGDQAIHSPAFLTAVNLVPQGLHHCLVLCTVHNEQFVEMRIPRIQLLSDEINESSVERNDFADPQYV